jgi:hypothetical protein
VDQVGANAHATATTAEAVSDRWMKVVRPATSDAGPATRSARPRPRVVSETVRVLLAVETSNCAASSGRIAWVL